MQQDTEALFSRTCAIARQLTNQASSERRFFFLTAIDRLALHLCDYYERMASNKVCQVQSTQQEISDEIGFSLKTVSRCLKRLNENNMIQIERKKIVINENQYLKLSKLVEEKLN